MPSAGLLVPGLGSLRAAPAVNCPICDAPPVGRTHQEPIPWTESKTMRAVVLLVCSGKDRHAYAAPALAYFNAHRKPGDLG